MRLGSNFKTAYASSTGTSAMFHTGVCACGSGEVFVFEKAPDLVRGNDFILQISIHMDLLLSFKKIK